jgi:hypothetical protein
MPKLGDLACPEMSGETRFEGDHTRWNVGEKGKDLTSPDLPPKHRGAVGRGAMNLKHVLRDIQPNDCDGGHV